MSRLVMLIMFLALVGLIGYAVFRSFPYLTSAIKSAPSQIQKVIPKASTSPTPTPNPSPSTSAITPNYDNLPDVNAYLTTNIGIKSHSGQLICGYVLLGTNQEPVSIIYIWAICQEYYNQKGVIKLGTGINLPLALNLVTQNSGYEVTNYTQPRNGNNSSQDISTIFPNQISQNIKNRYYYPQLLQLQNQLNTQAGYR